MDKSYPIKIGGSEYIVSGFGDRLGTPPSARGFNLKTFSLGLKKYETVYQATEENGYAFIIYADGDKKLILKGGQGSDHKETVMASSKELQSIRKEKYADQDDMNFLRKTCLSGRAWLVPLKGKNYYFVGIWNTSITQNQYDVLKEYLTKFPASATYIQMGMAGTGPSSEFQLLSGFSPKIVSDKPKLSNKEKEFVRTAHMRASELPAGYAKQLQKLRNMTEADTFMSNYQAYETYKNYALKMIPKLERIKSLGKAKTAARDIVTQSSVESILMGLGKNYPELTKKLQSLLKYSYHYSELVKLHNKGKIDSTNWRDPSMDGVINENAEMAKSDLTKLDEVRIARELEEGWKDWVAAGAIGLGALSGSPALAAKQAVKPAITKSVTKGSEASLLNKKTSDYIGQWEGKRNAMYLDTEKKPTIGIGHYLNNTQQDRDLFKALFGNVVNYDDVLKGKQKLTDDQIEKLFNVDVKVKEKMASSKISNFTSLPQYVKNAVINAFYRGDMGPKTVKLMNSGNWGAAAKEYLNHQNARGGPDQIQRRMKTNALAFAQFAKNQSEYFGFNYAIG
tara:strand:+ start:4188 stop:5885 length:1698 start_codon:yes stop_codon:yes gene_type:complete